MARAPPRTPAAGDDDALHIWSMSHGVASLFARGDAARRKLPMSAEDLLEAEVLIYLRGLGCRRARRPRGGHRGATGLPYWRLAPNLRQAALRLRPSTGMGAM